MRFFLSLALLPSVMLAHAGVPQIHVFNHENVLGTSLELKVSAPSEIVAMQAEAAVLAEIDRTANIISTYDPGSDYSRWFMTQNEPVQIAPELLEVLRFYDDWHSRTGGALDAGAEAISQVWKQAASVHRLPDPDEIAGAVAAARGPHWKLDDGTRTAAHLSKTPLSLNSIGKGYIVGRACDAALKINGVVGVVVNIGGDLCVRGELNEQVEIVNPRDDAENAGRIARITIRNHAVATSGNYRRGVDIAGRHYSHIVDPRTGQPVDEIISVTVVASNSIEANALATTFCVLRPEESLRLASALPGVECLLVRKDGGRIASRGWASLETPVQIAAAGDVHLGTGKESSPPPTNSGNWDDAFELTVNFELARFTGRATRPFVAAWVEDKDKFPVRTLALWYRGDRWLPDMRSWYQSDQLRALAEGTNIIASVSSATRAPGKYTLKWDGRDSSGKPVKVGKYTVLIEAAREHGTHQLIRQEMDFSGGPQHFDLPANVEISSASLDYHKKVP